MQLDAAGYVKKAEFSHLVNSRWDGLTRKGKEAPRGHDIKMFRHNDNPLPVDKPATAMSFALVLNYLTGGLNCA